MGVRQASRCRPVRQGVNYSEPLTEVRVRGSTRVEIKILFFDEGFVKENRNSKKHGLEKFWSMDFQSDLTFFLVNIF